MLEKQRTRPFPNFIYVFIYTHNVLSEYGANSGAGWGPTFDLPADGREGVRPSLVGREWSTSVVDPGAATLSFVGGRLLS